MSEKYLIVCEPEQVPPYDPQAIAEGLGLSLLAFLGPLLLELDQWLDKRLIRTFVQTIEAMLTFRDRINGLLLSELGSYLDPIGKGGGSKRLSRLLHSSKWSAASIERFLWWRARKPGGAVGKPGGRGAAALGEQRVGEAGKPQE